MATPANLAAAEAEIQALVAQGQQDEARARLFDLIVGCAKSGDLNNANRLRDMLYEVDPMALQDIIKANEMIEEAMSGAVSDSFNQAWTGLREALPEEEFLAFYHALDEHDVEAGKAVVKKDSKLDAVFFINKGNLRVTCQSGGKTVEVKTLEPGTMISENCFSPSVWTVSVTSLTPVNLSILRLERLVDLEARYPGFEGRLVRYYTQFDTVWEQLQGQDLNRRLFKRSTVDCKITFQVSNRNNTLDDRTFRGELLDLSQGGLAFAIRIVKRENRRMLFGRRLVVTGQSEGKPFQFSGTVIAVSCHDIQDHDYAVHVAFDEPAAEEIIRPLLPPEPAEQEEMTAPDGEEMAGPEKSGGEEPI